MPQRRSRQPGAGLILGVMNARVRCAGAHFRMQASNLRQIMIRAKGGACVT
jgi:hypothetical protein